MNQALYTTYKDQVVKKLKKDFDYKNIMEVPRIEKVVLNVGYGRQVKNKSFIETVDNTLKSISGQKPVHNKAKKSISNFKIREGMDVGASVTLRGKEMYAFLYKLINVVFPRVRDFRGLNPKSFDRNGNYSLGIKESIAFPEVTAESSEKIHGIDICITTSANTAEEGEALLRALGMPLREGKKKKSVNKNS